MYLCSVHLNTPTHTHDSVFRSGSVWSDMQLFFSKLLLWQTYPQGVNQMHGVVSLGAVFSSGAVS